jgi:AhpD family alkylhydroperoxidase
VGFLRIVDIHGEWCGQDLDVKDVPTPATIEAAPIASRPLLEGVKKQLGVVPNMFCLISNSPAALESYLDLSSALNKGALPPPTRERIALAVAEINGCDYCLSAHSYLCKNLAKLDDAEIPRRMPLCGSRSRSCASTAMSLRTMSTPSSPPVTTMRK